MANRELSITIQLDRILDDYSKETRRKVNNTIDDVAKEAASRLRATSPRRPGGGKYAKGWRVKRERSEQRGIIKAIVRNASRPQLTHLLENGHVVKNGTDGNKAIGRAEPHVHIKPVEEWANAELTARLEREL